MNRVMTFIINNNGVYQIKDCYENPEFDKIVFTSMKIDEINKYIETHYKITARKFI